MFTIDTASIDGSKDEVYSVDRGSRVKVFLGDKEVKMCAYVNVTKGVAICVKKDIGGTALLFNNSIIHELVFGEFTVEPLDKG